MGSRTSKAYLQVTHFRVPLVDVVGVVVVVVVVVGLDDHVVGGDEALAVRGSALAALHDHHHNHSHHHHTHHTDHDIQDLRVERLQSVAWQQKNAHSSICCS